MNKSLDLIGIGNAIVDVLTQTEHSFIQTNQINKGAMTLIEEGQAEELYAKMGPAMEISGGSAANTIAAFASLGGSCGFIGKVADDQLGGVFRHDIQATGAVYNTVPLTGGLPTARCLIMVTPDADRTMCTFLGASVWITPGDIEKDFIQSAKVILLEGYLFDKPQAKKAFMKAAELAHEGDTKTALSLSDPFCVTRHREEFLDLIDNHIDILFANEAELKCLFQTESLEEALVEVKGKCELVVVTRGAEGSVIVIEDQQYDIPAEDVETVVDTTGAGDLYAAGFLYGYTRDEDIETCGHYGSTAAAAVLHHMGARPQQDISKCLSRVQARLQEQKKIVRS
ncbi:MAG: adenosine kinase [Pseudomonadota bacterium]